MGSIAFCPSKTSARLSLKRYSRAGYGPPNISLKEPQYIMQTISGQKLRTSLLHMLPYCVAAAGIVGYVAGICSPLTFNVLQFNSNCAPTNVQTHPRGWIGIHLDSSQSVRLLGLMYILPSPRRMIHRKADSLTPCVCLCGHLHVRWSNTNYVNRYPNKTADILEELKALPV